MKAERFIDGIPVNPIEPEDLDDTPNEERPPEHDEWWGVPFIRTTTVEELDALNANDTSPYAEDRRKHWEDGRKAWLEAWPSGTRWEVRCLDGGAWDRSTGWGMFATLGEAVECVKRAGAH